MRLAGKPMRPQDGALAAGPRVEEGTADGLGARPPRAQGLLVVADGADLVADLGHVGRLLDWVGRAGARPHVGDFAHLALLGGLVDVLAERLAGLVLQIPEALADERGM